MSRNENTKHPPDFIIKRVMSGHFGCIHTTGVEQKLNANCRVYNAATGEWTLWTEEQRRRRSGKEISSPSVEEGLSTTHTAVVQSLSFAAE